MQDQEQSACGEAPPPALPRLRVPRRCASTLGLILLCGMIAATQPVAARGQAQEQEQPQAPLDPDASGDAADGADPMAGIDPDALWEAQPDLLAKAVDALPRRVAGRTNIYAIAVAAQGAPPLFAREAHRAAEVAAAGFGDDYRGGIILSNGLADLFRRPLATRGNLVTAARGVGGRIDPARDVAFVYLASHGAPGAWLSTDLPNDQALRPITATALATALSQAGIRRRIVVISACYGASWIPALADDDTIVIAAAAKDRSSFGCNDERELTYFGEALLQGPLAHGASLRDAFEAARRTVARWEAQEQLTPSLPQAHVGRNMRALWTRSAAPGGPVATEAGAAARN